MPDWLGDPLQVLHLPVGDWITTGISWAVESWRPLLQTLRLPISTLLRHIQQNLIGAPPTLVLSGFTVVAWQLAG